MNDLRLIETAFPIEEVSEACSREKSIRHGHLSTLQSWWARRPLGVCRAAIFATLCAPEKVELDRELCDEICIAFPESSDLKSRLTAMAAKLSTWEAKDNDLLLRLAHRVIVASCGSVPLVADTFAGGGSMPLESQRLGLDSYAGELNPVAITALRVISEILPGTGSDVIEQYKNDVRRIDDRLKEFSSDLYGSQEGSTPLAFFWCRTYQCPSCDTSAPLLQNKWLAKGPRNVAVRLRVQGDVISFEVYSPESRAEKRDADLGTISAQAAQCAACGFEVRTAFLQSQAATVGLGERMYAKLNLMSDGKRSYQNISNSDCEAFEQSSRQFELKSSQEKVDHYDLDINGIRHLWAIQYGVATTGDIFNPRQALVLLMLHDEIKSSRSEERATASLIPYILMALSLNRVLVYSNRHSWWQSNGEFPASIFVRQGISMVWNYVEIPMMSEGAGGWASASVWITRIAEHLQRVRKRGSVVLGSADSAELEDGSVDLVAIDPPYYNAITYAYLSDVFYPWMKSLLGNIFPSDFSGDRPSREREAIVDRPHKLAKATKGREHFESMMGGAFAEANRVLRPSGRLLVMYGHKEPVAWAAMLGPIIRAGFRPTVSWPVHTERKSKFRHARIAALSSSCVMIFDRAPAVEIRTLDWPEFVSKLKAQLSLSLGRFISEHFFGSDLFGAVISPAVAEFQRYRVQESGKDVSLELFIQRLPEIVNACELDAIASQLSAIERKSLKCISSSLLLNDCADGELHGLSDLVAITSGDAAGNFALRYLQEIASSSYVVADELWSKVRPKTRAESLLVLRLVSASGVVASAVRGHAAVALGRIAMIAVRT